MSNYTYDLNYAHIPALVQSGMLSERGQDDRKPLEQMRREDLKRLLQSKGFEVTDYHRKQDLLAIAQSGIRPPPPPPPAIPSYGEEPVAHPPAPRVIPDPSEGELAAARASLLSEIKGWQFMKLKHTAKRYGLDCPGGMTAAQKHSLCEELAKRIEGE